MELFDIVILALIQGITEFLPISSSGHLALWPLLTGRPDQGPAMDAAVAVSHAAGVKSDLKSQTIRARPAMTHTSGQRKTPTPTKASMPNSHGRQWRGSTIANLITVASSSPAATFDASSSCPSAVGCSPSSRFISGTPPTPSM